MKEKSFKERVRMSMIELAREYKEKFVDYEYLVCSEAFKNNDYYLIAAEKDNFQHLTGVHALINPNSFFDKCYEGSLTQDDFDFLKKGHTEKAVKGTVRRKIQVLPEMMCLFEKGLQAEECFQKNSIVCAFATTDGNFTLGFCDSVKTRPKSIIKGNELKNTHPVELILRRKSSDLKFNEIVYGNENMLNKYSKKIKHLLSDKLEKFK